MDSLALAIIALAWVAAFFLTVLLNVLLWRIEKRERLRRYEDVQKVRTALLAAALHTQTMKAVFPPKKTE